MPSADPTTSYGTLIVLAKNPVPGLVKTRLMAAYSASEAADLAAAALADTLDAVAATPAKRRLLVLAGEPDRWQRPDLEIEPQRGGGLDERLAHAFSLVGTGDCLLIGMDTPQVTPLLLTKPVGAPPDAWFGPSLDGGFWALGFAAPPDPAWLLGVPMSQPNTGRLQRQRLTAAGLTVTDLQALRDVDSPADVPLVARDAPASRFAKLASALAARQ